MNGKKVKYRYIYIEISGKIQVICCPLHVEAVATFIFIYGANPFATFPDLCCNHFRPIFISRRLHTNGWQMYSANFGKVTNEFSP